MRFKNLLRLVCTFFVLASFYQLAAEKPDIKFNSWELIIYRPENSSSNYHGMNEVRCWFKLEDEEGNDVTYTKCKATYEWASMPDKVNFYEKSYYLSGGMAMHLIIQSGKYKISFYTPEDKQFGVKTPEKKTWTSNVFEYDTDNPAKVLFVYPGANDNGFYDGSWIVDYRAPKWFKFTKPKMK